MTRPELTYDEFCALPMTYCMGMSFETKRQCMYRNYEHGVQKETSIRRDPFTNELGKTTTIFFLDNDFREFANRAECYVAYMEHACGIKEKS